MLTDLQPAHITTLWNHLRIRHATRAETAEAFLTELQDRNPTDIIMACLDRRGEDWDAILSALMNRPLYKCAPGETAFPLTDMKGQRIAGPQGHRVGHTAEATVPAPASRRGHPRPPRPRKKDPRVIQDIAPNPKLQGSQSYERYALYKEGMTVDEFLDAGGRRADISHDVKKGFIRLGYDVDKKVHKT